MAGGALRSGRNESMLNGVSCAWVLVHLGTTTNVMGRAVGKGGPRPQTDVGDSSYLLKALQQGHRAASYV